MCFWTLNVPDMFDYMLNSRNKSLGVSRGILCIAFIDLNYGHLTVWHLKSSTRDQTTVWDRRYTELDVAKVVNTCPETFGLVHDRSFHVNPNVVFLLELQSSPRKPW